MAALSEASRLLVKGRRPARTRGDARDLQFQTLWSDGSAAQASSTTGSSRGPSAGARPLISDLAALFTLLLRTEAPTPIPTPTPACLVSFLSLNSH